MAVRKAVQKVGVAVATLIGAHQASALSPIDAVDPLRQQKVYCSTEDGDAYTGLSELCIRALSDPHVAKALEGCLPCNLTGEGANPCLTRIKETLQADPRTSNLKQLARSANAVAEIRAVCDNPRR